MISKKNYLVVDDDSIAIFLIEKIITNAGLANQIYKAINGQQAINVLLKLYDEQTALPDIILLDLNMPVMDGFQFIEAFKKLQLNGKENIRIIIVSSSNNPHDMAKAQSLGVNHYLTKPLSVDNLKGILEKVY